MTICTRNKEKLLCNIVGGGILDAPLVELSVYGKIIDRQINNMNNIYHNIKTEKYVIMPNHIHLMIMVDNNNWTSGTPSPTNAIIQKYISALKRYCNKEAGFNIFQRLFHDHIVRNEADYLKIWHYIDTNPVKWREDCFYVE